jgi:hypothetical protein
MAVFEERGLFWWHGEPIPDRRFAPDAAISGLLSIADEGFTDLILDGCLPTDQGTFAMLSQNHIQLKGKSIEGILTPSNRHILLVDRQFGTRCAQIRNDISHFGEQRNRSLYDEFIKEVTYKARALSTLYHMIILHEIGIDKETINDWIYVRSSSARTTLVEGGLLDEQTPPLRRG